MLVNDANYADPDDPSERGLFGLPPVSDQEKEQLATVPGGCSREARGLMATRQDPRSVSTQALLVALAEEQQKTVELTKELARRFGISLRPNGDTAIRPTSEQ